MTIKLDRKLEALISEDYEGLPAAGYGEEDKSISYIILGSEEGYALKIKRTKQRYEIVNVYAEDEEDGLRGCALDTVTALKNRQFNGKYEFERIFVDEEGNFLTMMSILKQRSNGNGFVRVYTLRPYDEEGDALGKPFKIQYGNPSMRRR